MEKKMLNPFICQGYVRPAFFCDRVTETEALLKNFENGRNVTLVCGRVLLVSCFSAFSEKNVGKGHFLALKFCSLRNLP